MDAYPLLWVLRERERIHVLRQQQKLSVKAAMTRFAELRPREEIALNELREILARYPSVSQHQVARALRVDRTMVNKVWNSGRPGPERQWTRSVRIVAATYRALEAAGWSPRPPESAEKEQ